MAKLGLAIDSLAAATRKAGEEQTALLREFVDALRRGSGPVQTVSLPSPAPQRAERLVWALAAMVAALCAGLLTSIVFGLQQGQRITDMRADFARDIDRMERRQDAHTGWALDESNMTRGYIWTGKVPVANPHPKEQ